VRRAGYCAATQMAYGVTVTVWRLPLLMPIDTCHAVEDTGPLVRTFIKSSVLFSPDDVYPPPTTLPELHVTVAPPVM
jgi:hypothetical protein